MAYIIRGARDATGMVGDYCVADGKFVEQGPTGAEIVDADGLIILPGLVDLHTHLREPGREDAETVASGSLAAARGGFTAVHAMANTTPVTDTAARAERVLQLGVDAKRCQVVPVGAITRGLGGEELADLSDMANSRAVVRVFSDDGRCVMDARLMRSAFEQVAQFDGVLMQHSQDANLAGPTACCHEGELSARLGLDGWPPVAESIIIARDAQLAQATGARLHVAHITSAEGVEVVRWAKARGINITAEVTPHHLLLGVDELATYDTTYKVNPPLRTDEHIEALRAALADGTIDTIGTDHAPHASCDKQRPFSEASPGMLGLEQALGVVIETMVSTGRLTWTQVIDRMSIAPARIGRLSGQGRPLTLGEPANFVLVDPTRRTTVDRASSASVSRNNPYHGRDLPDPVMATMWRGTFTWRRD